MDARPFVVSLAALALSACSLLLDRRADQCASDSNCARFSGTHCDLLSRLCITSSNQSDGGHPSASDDGGTRGDEPTSCVGANGCYRCAPTNDLQFANGCTDSQCKPFDNKARVKNLPPDGGLTPLPEREAGQLKASAAQIK